MNFNLDLTMDKNAIFERVAAIIKDQNFTIVQQDMTRPWGGFFVLAEDQSSAFAKLFFPNLEMSQIQITNKLSPKILVVAPNKRLSWQYHFRCIF